MEPAKRVRTRAKSIEEKSLNDSEINGEKSVPEPDECPMEVAEFETAEIIINNENDQSVDEVPTDKVVETAVEEKEDELPNKENESENEIPKKNRKRKVSENSKEDKDNVDDKSVNNKSIEQGEEENIDKAEKSKEEDKSLSEELNMPPVQGFGKGKRARIPNKRYSDIAISPSVKIVKPTYLENGEKEKVTTVPIAKPIERITSESSGTSSPVPKRQKMSVDLSNPNFMKPFKFGWKRELVWRSVGDVAGKRNGDIYYYSPEGKKFRSMREVMEGLKTKELTIDDFTFFKEPLGLNDPEKELIRDAKVKSASSIGPKKSTPLKSKKVMSPKVLSPKVMSPRVEAKANAAQTAKISSPKVHSTKLEQTDEGKNSKPKAASSPSSKNVNTSADSGAEEKLQKSATLKVKITSKPRAEKKGAAPKQVTTTNSEEDVGMPAKKTPAKKGKWPQKPVVSNEISKTSPKRKTLRLNNVQNSVPEKPAESRFMENYLQNLAYGYSTLLYVFQYLKVQDLLRSGCVCTMWRDIASHPLLWRTVRMKNSQVHSFEGLANTLQKHGTVQLDLRKMLLTNCDERWPEFSNNIGKVETLRKIELCRCPASVVENLTETNPKLEVVNAVTIRCETMNLEGLANWTNLRELRLKSTTGLTLKSDIESLRSLSNLKTLSLTSVKDLNKMKLDVIAELSNLESLDLGECTDFPENFGKDILMNLKKLEKLRLEKGQGNCHTFEILEAVKEMEQLEQLELVNFDIKAGFDKALGACKNIKKLLIIPTYISQSATTNHMVLGGVLRLQKSLSHFVWGVTLELLRVTELFVDQCEEPEKKEKKEKKLIGNGDSIPVLKPVPLITDDNSEIPPALDPPQVEILALPGLQKLLLQSLPTTRVKILKVPFHATWRQSITDAVN